MAKIVVKISSNLLNPDKKETSAFLEKLGNEISTLKKEGHSIIIVTSGAVMHGLKTLGLNKKPSLLPMLQSCASIGQIVLMNNYQNLFNKHNIVIGQILVSSDDFRVRNRYLNLRNTVEALLSIGAIPVFNENDSINIEELKLGDNDNLSTIITIMMNFELLILLTDVDGLYDNDPKIHKDAKLVENIDNLTADYLKMTGGANSAFSTGGMRSKIESALKATKAGVSIFIGNGFKVSLLKIIKKEERGTYINSKKTELNARKKWIGISPTTHSKIHIDNGAYQALLKNSSLLASGITKVEGSFSKGALVNIVFNDKKIAQGLTNYSSKEIDLVKGKKSSEFDRILGKCDYEEIIHKDNLFLVN